MKKPALIWRFIAVSFLCLPFAVKANNNGNYPLECRGQCASNCISWYINYSDNCDCIIDEFISIHYMGMVGGIPFLQINTHETQPGWVGLNAIALGCDCVPCS
ncbi:MAG: hypothetical protein H6562_16160 [Lewinellaceae bacterium]|nr:hypothetical protein [Lewinellaceae bacterium]